MYPFFQKRIPVSEVDSLSYSDSKIIRFKDTVDSVFINDQKNTIIKTKKCKDIVIFTHYFEDFEKNKTYTFTGLNTTFQSKRAIYIIQTDKKILLPLFILNYFFLVIVLLLFIIMILILKFFFKKPMLSQEEEVNLYLNILEKYIKDDVFFKKINDSTVFISPRFRKTFEAIKEKSLTENNPETKEKIEQFYNKCFGKLKTGGKNAEENNQN